MIYRSDIYSEFIYCACLLCSLSYSIPLQSNCIPVCALVAYETEALAQTMKIPLNGVDSHLLKSSLPCTEPYDRTESKRKPSTCLFSDNRIK